MCGWGRGGGGQRQRAKKRGGERRRMIKEERKISYERDNTMSNDYSRRSCDVTESGPSPIANGPVAGSPVVVRRTYSTVTLLPRGFKFGACPLYGRWLSLLDNAIDREGCGARLLPVPRTGKAGDNKTLRIMNGRRLL